MLHGISHNVISKGNTAGYVHNFIWLPQITRRLNWSYSMRRWNLFGEDVHESMSAGSPSSPSLLVELSTQIHTRKSVFVREMTKLKSDDGIHTFGKRDWRQWIRNRSYIHTALATHIVYKLSYYTTRMWSSEVHSSDKDPRLMST